MSNQAEINLPINSQIGLMAIKEEYNDKFCKVDRQVDDGRGEQYFDFLAGCMEKSINVCRDNNINQAIPSCYLSDNAPNVNSKLDDMTVKYNSEGNGGIRPHMPTGSNRRIRVNDINNSLQVFSSEATGPNKDANHTMVGVSCDKTKLNDNINTKCIKKKGHLCSFCGKLYTRKYGLKIHMRIHAGYKPLSCKFCHMRFGDPSNMTKHVRLHVDTLQI